MADWVTISSLATASGTLVLAIATFSSVRSANRAARAAERSLLAGLCPVLIPSREDDPDERVVFGEGHRLTLRGHGAVLELAEDDNIYMAMGLRNAGAGLAVLHGWRAMPYASPGTPGTPDAPSTYAPGAHDAPDLDEFRRQLRDIYIAAGDYGFWQGAIRDNDDPSYEGLRDAAGENARIFVDLLYGDHEGGQRTIARFGVATNEEGTARTANVIRYWNIDRDDPR